MQNKDKEKVNPVRNFNQVNLTPYIIGLVAFILVGIVIIKFVALNNNTDYFFQIASPATYDQSLLITSFSRIFSIQPVNARSARMIQEKSNVVRYINAYNNTDVVQTRHTAKLKEDIILKQPGHPDRFEYRINLDQYDFKEISNGDFVFYSKGKAGNELAKIFTIPAPYMIDSNNNKSSVEDVKTTLTQEGLLIIEPNLNWLKNASYPVILDPTIEINILNIHSHPQQGDNWEVEFTTQGQADLKIIPDDQATIDDDEFITLTCNGEERRPQILEGDVIYYSDWECGGIGKVLHNTLKADQHTLRFEFGDQIAYAYNKGEATYEFLIRVEDKLTSKEEDCITFKPAGWDWGSMERQHYAILEIQDITYEQAKEWCSFKEEGLTVYTFEGKEKKYQPKKYSFVLKDMPEDNKNDWKNQDKKVSPTLFNKEKIKLK